MTAERTDNGSTLHYCSAVEYFAYMMQPVLIRPWVYVMLMLCLRYTLGPAYYRQLHFDLT